jgi:hypothetical protein
MLGRPPVRLRWEQAHLFKLDAQGGVRPWRMNAPLRRPEGAADEDAAS